MLSFTKTSCMKAVITFVSSCIVFLVFSATVCAQADGAKNSSANATDTLLMTFVIERDIPGAGKFTPSDLKSASQQSCTVIKELGPGIQWIHSYVTGNKIYCIYKAKNETILLDHAKKSGFPANKISEVTAIIDPLTAQ